MEKTPPSLGIAAIFKNEAPYIIEWIAACKIAGAKRIYIADNNSSDGSSELLSALDQAQIITHIPFPGERNKAPQLPAYQEIMAKHGTEVEWMAFIDADEFFNFGSSGKNLPQILEELLNQDANVGAIGVNWAIYGSSHKNDYEDAPVISRFTHRARQDAEINCHYKSIVRTRAFKSTGSTPHTFSLWPEFHYLMADGRPLAHHPSHGPGLSTEAIWSPVRLDHYVIKSREEFNKKKKPNGSAATVGRIKGDDYYQQHDHNEVLDIPEAERIQALEKEMKLIKSLIAKNILDGASFHKQSTSAEPAPLPTGHIDQIELENGELKVRGWSAMEIGSEASALTISWTDGLTTCTNMQKISRPDVKKKFASLDSECGFLAVFAPPNIPPASTDLRRCTFEISCDTKKIKLSTSGQHLWRYVGEGFPGTTQALSIPNAPAMPTPCIEFLSTAMRSCQTYLEYGSGGSTIMASRFPIKNIISVESDASWLKAVEEKFKSTSSNKNNLSPLHINIGPTKSLGYPIDDSNWKEYWRYPITPWEHCKKLGAEPDLVLIDGRFRLACFLATLLNAPAGCQILFDDYSDRPHYHLAENFLTPITQIDRMTVFVVPPNRPDTRKIAHTLAQAINDPR